MLAQPQDTCMDATNGVRRETQHLKNHGRRAKSKQRAKEANRPEAGHVTLVHLPDGIVADGEQHEAVRVVLQQLLVVGRALFALSLAFNSGLLSERDDRSNS